MTVDVESWKVMRQCYRAVSTNSAIALLTSCQWHATYLHHEVNLLLVHSHASVLRLGKPHVRLYIKQSFCPEVQFSYHII